MFRNKSAKLTQNTPVVFVVNSMVMTTFLGAGFSIRYSKLSFWTIQGPKFRSAQGIWQVTELGPDIMPTNIFTKFDKDRMKTI